MAISKYSIHGLTEGKEYDVIATKYDLYLIEFENGGRVYFHKNYFEGDVKMNKFVKEARVRIEKANRIEAENNLNKIKEATNMLIAAGINPKVLEQTIKVAKEKDELQKVTEMYYTEQYKNAALESEIEELKEDVREFTHHLIIHLEYISNMDVDSVEFNKNFKELQHECYEKVSYLKLADRLSETIY